VIEPLEDADDYKAFEQAVTADYDAETAVERELVLRLASLLWRLRRSTSIETGLLQIQTKVLRQQQTRATQTPPQDRTLIAALRISRLANVVRSQNACSDDYANSEIVANTGSKPAARVPDPRLDIAQCFLRLSNLDSGMFEQLDRYEMPLWRQVRQTLFTLERLRGRPSSARSWRTQRPWPRTIGVPPVAESEG
jgi:hypothetical protein